MIKIKILSMLVCFLFISTVANAALVDNGDGTITDTDTNLMWLQDANYAMTSGYDSDGLMTWTESLFWADNLVYAGYEDWQLPSALSSDSTHCEGLNCNESWMGNLYYTEEITFANQGPFINIQNNAYMSPDIVVQNEIFTISSYFAFDDGIQTEFVASNNIPHYALAVRVVPEPISSTLFIVGGATLGFRRYMRRRQ